MRHGYFRIYLFSVVTGRETASFRVFVEPLLTLAFVQDCDRYSANAHARARSLDIHAMPRPYSLLASLSALAMVASPVAVSAQSAPLNVSIDQAVRVPLRGAAGSVIVGNPQIADVTVVDSNTLYITGKGYGVTEIVAVDAIGRTVFERQVIVSDGTGAGRVRVWRGGQSTEMACGSSCSPTSRGSSGGSSTSSAPPASQ